jgi:hypothetical protein
LNVFYRLFFLSLSSFFLFLVHRYSFFYLPKADMSLPCGGGGNISKRQNLSRAG